MMKLPFKAVLFTLVGLVAVGSLVSQAPAVQTPSGSPDQAKVSDSVCSTTGVTLVLDFGSTTKPTEQYCVENFSGTGWQLFELAGQTVEGTAEYPASFVCRINGYPDSKNEDCLGTPDFGNGSWVYYVARSESNSGEWVRSGAGAAARKPECGDFEGWRFVKGFSQVNLPPSVTAAPFRCE